MKRTSCSEKLVIFLMILGLSFPGYAAEMYRWIDKEGVVHFSTEQPEESKDITRLKIPDAEPISDIPAREMERTSQSVTAPKQKLKKDMRRQSSRSQQKLENFPLLFQKHNWCVIASMEMIFRYYGYDVDQDMIFQNLKGRRSRVREGEGLDDRTAARFLNRSGFTVDHREGGDLDMIKKYIDNNVPVMWGHVAPGKWEGSRHMSVIIGYDDAYMAVIVADPSFGRELSIPYDDFKKWWGMARNVMIAVSK
ncbi:MAG: C39 family peptidase [Syntrophaceae bacterium]